MDDTFKAVLSGIAAVVLIFFLFLGLAAMGWCGRQASKIAEPAVERYEEYQSMYNAAKASHDKICMLEKLDGNDPMFSQISKAAQLNAQKSIFIRWINEYNAKSDMRNTREMWKSSTLPQHINLNSFDCP